VAAANKGLNAAYRIGTDSARAGVGHAAHCCTSPLYISCGASARVVMEILGHSGIAITMNAYANVLPTLLGDTVGGMDDVLG